MQTTERTDSFGVNSIKGLFETYLDSVFRVVATSVHIETGVHTTTEVTPLRNGTGDRQADERCIMDAALIQGPVCCGLNRVRPELKHSSGD